MICQVTRPQQECRINYIHEQSAVEKYHERVEERSARTIFESRPKSRGAVRTQAPERSGKGKEKRYLPIGLKSDLRDLECKYLPHEIRAVVPEVALV